MKNFSENKYTKVVTLRGKSSVRQTLGYKEFTTENIRADYEAELMKETN